MKTSGSVTVKRGDKTYAATFTVEHGMLHVATHTETRAVALGDGEPEQAARNVLVEIIDAARPQ